MFKFKYLKRRGRFFPIIPVILANNKQKFQVEALMDSGASISLFHANITKHLNIDLEKCKRIEMVGLGGRIIGYLHNINLQIRNIKFKCKIIFSREMPTKTNLLGRDNFFKKFTVSFYENKKQVSLKIKNN